MTKQRKRASPRPRLAGVHEVAELLGISKSALADRRRARGFPQPLTTLRCGPIWDLNDIRAYQRTRERHPFAFYLRASDQPRRRRR